MNEVLHEASENYASKDEKLTKKDLIYRQVSTCMSNFNKEKRSGYWIFSQVAGLKPQRLKYLGDSRKETIESVKCLHDLLLSIFDKDLKAEFQKINKQDLEFTKKILTTKLTEPQKELLWEERIEIYRNVFQKILAFVEKKKWFETASLTD